MRQPSVAAPSAESPSSLATVGISSVGQGTAAAVMRLQQRQRGVFWGRRCRAGSRAGAGVSKRERRVGEPRARAAAGHCTHGSAAAATAMHTLGGHVGHALTVRARVGVGGRVVVGGGRRSFFARRARRGAARSWLPPGCPVLGAGLLGSTSPGLLDGGSGAWPVGAALLPRPCRAGAACRTCCPCPAPRGRGAGLRLAGLPGGPKRPNGDSLSPCSRSSSAVPPAPPQAHRSVSRQPCRELCDGLASERLR
jgi:hypothetical protein